VIEKDFGVDFSASVRAGQAGSQALSACLAITERLSCILKFLRVLCC